VNWYRVMLSPLMQKVLFNALNLTESNKQLTHSLTHCLTTLSCTAAQTSNITSPKWWHNGAPSDDVSSYRCRPPIWLLQNLVRTDVGNTGTLWELDGNPMATWSEQGGKKKKKKRKENVDCSWVHAVNLLIGCMNFFIFYFSKTVCHHFFFA